MGNCVRREVGFEIDENPEALIGQELIRKIGDMKNSAQIQNEVPEQDLNKLDIYNQNYFETPQNEIDNKLRNKSKKRPERENFNDDFKPILDIDSDIDLNKNNNIKNGDNYNGKLKNKNNNGINYKDFNNDYNKPVISNKKNNFDNKIVPENIDMNNDDFDKLYDLNKNYKKNNFENDDDEIKENEINNKFKI